VTKQWTRWKVGSAGLALSAALGGLVACGNSSSPQANGDLARDLAAVSDTSSLALAPAASGTQVISAVEEAPQARRAPRAASQAPTVVHRVQHHVTAPVAAPVQAPVAQAPVVAQAPQPDPAPVQSPAPRPHPVQQQEHHGRYRTEAEVIRDAPFPIMP
jgi:hypothetical protein